MVCGARLNINLWQAVRRRAGGEWNERGNSLLSSLGDREWRSARGGCSVPLKCDMRSLTYKLNVTTGGQFYFNRGDHRQATIHFPLFFPPPCPPSFTPFRFFFPLFHLSAHTLALFLLFHTRSNNRVGFSTDNQRDHEIHASNESRSPPPPQLHRHFSLVTVCRPWDLRLWGALPRESLQLSYRLGIASEK